MCVAVVLSYRCLKNSRDLFFHCVANETISNHNPLYPYLILLLSPNALSTCSWWSSFASSINSIQPSLGRLITHHSVLHLTTPFRTTLQHTILHQVVVYRTTRHYTTHHYSPPHLFQPHTTLPHTSPHPTGVFGAASRLRRVPALQLLRPIIPNRIPCLSQCSAQMCCQTPSPPSCTDSFISCCRYLRTLCDCW